MHYGARSSERSPMFITYYVYTWGEGSHPFVDHHPSQEDILHFGKISDRPSECYFMVPVPLNEMDFDND